MTAGFLSNLVFTYYCRTRACCLVACLRSVQGSDVYSDREWPPSPPSDPKSVAYKTGLRQVQGQQTEVNTGASTSMYKLPGAAIFYVTIYCRWDCLMCCCASYGGANDYDIRILLLYCGTRQPTAGRVTKIQHQRNYKNQRVLPAAFVLLLRC